MTARIEQISKAIHEDLFAQLFQQAIESMEEAIEASTSNDAEHVFKIADEGDKTFVHNADNDGYLSDISGALTITFVNDQIACDDGLSVY